MDYVLCEVYSLFTVIISLSFTEDTVTNNEMNLILSLEAITIDKKGMH